MERNIPVVHIRPKPPPRVWLLLLYAGYKNDTGDKSFVKRKGTFRSVGPKCPDRSRTTFTGEPNWTELQLFVPFDFVGILGWMESAFSQYFYFETF